MNQEAPTSTSGGMFTEGEYDCIVQQFDECLQQIAKEQESSDFKTTNKEYFN